MQGDRQLEISLALMRYSTAIFLLVWSIDKTLNAKSAQAVFANFYFWKSAPATALLAIGIVQTIIVIAFALGIFKTWTYGAVMLMHATSTLASIGKMVPPYGPGASKLFWAAVPVLAAMIALFMLRSRDNWLTLGSFRNSTRVA